MILRSRTIFWGLVFACSAMAMLSAGCARQTGGPSQADDWEEQVIYADKCGMDGLPCCDDKGKPCLYGQECCADPNDPGRNMCADECVCGRKGAYCCAAGERCETDDLACFAGYCVECGQISDPCCQAGEQCSGALVCHKEICAACGLPGNPCCAAGAPCANQEKRDNSRTECVSGICLYCGSDSQIACRQEPVCAPAHLLNNGFCLSCGGPNQPCCDAGAADSACAEDSLACEKGFCTRK